MLSIVQSLEDLTVQSQRLATERLQNRSLTSAVTCLGLRQSNTDWKAGNARHGEVPLGTEPGAVPPGPRLPVAARGPDAVWPAVGCKQRVQLALDALHVVGGGALDALDREIEVWVEAPPSAMPTLGQVLDIAHTKHYEYHAKVH